MVKASKSFLFASLLIFSAVQAQAETDLYRAVRNNDLATLRTAVAEKANLEARGSRGVTPLMHAAAFGSLQSMKVLLDAGVDPNAKDSFGATALVWAAGDPAKAKLLIERGAEVNVQTNQGKTPLIVAAAHDGSSRTVRLLLDKGADIKAADVMGNTALLAASAANDFESVRVLLARGASANESNKGGYTPLMNAASNNNTAMIRLLIEKGADVNAANTFTDRVKFGDIALKQLTPLMLATPYGSPETIQMLIDARADVNARDSRGMTPLMFAVASENQDLAVVEMLIANGAEVNVRSEAGETALDCARKFANPRVLAALEKSGAEAFAAAPQAVIPANANTDAQDAVVRSVNLLQASSAEFFRQSGCVSCHHQNAVQMATAAARSAGIAVDETAAAESTKQVMAAWDLFGPALLERMDGPAPPDIQLASLYGLAAEKQPSGPITDMLAVNIAATQRGDGSWQLGGFPRAPMEESNLARTAMALRVLQMYGPPARKAEFNGRINKARKWLEKAAPKTTDDFVWRLAGLYWAGADSSKVVKASEALRKLQRNDGGFGPNPNLASDAYATATALWALHTAGAVAPDDEIYRRGVAFLLKTQHEDGSWHVRSRAPKFQPYFESGFPHGGDQWISSSATAWATVALAPAAQRTVSETGGPKGQPKQAPGRRTE